MRVLGRTTGAEAIEPGASDLRASSAGGTVRGGDQLLVLVRNTDQAAGPKASVPPARFLVSRIPAPPECTANSTQLLFWPL
jgi:hypothetical protein